MANFFKASPKKSPPKQALSLTISRLDPQGYGVAHHEKKPIFIEGALLNEVVEVNVFEQKSKYSKAKLIRVITPSVDRVDVKCKHYFQCGGCNLQHLAYQQQLIFKQDNITQLFARQGLGDKLPWQSHLESDPWHYRRKARIGVQYNKRGEPIIGFRQRESNHLTKIMSCPVLVKEFSNIFTELNTTLAKVSGKNAVGHVEVIAANENAVVVRQLVKLTTKDKQIWQDFAIRNQWLVYFDDGKNVTELADKKHLSYTLTDAIEIEFAVNNFIQVNHVVNQQMVKQAIAWLALSVDDNVLDLFCGLGNFSLPIAQQVNSVVGIEGVDSMVAKAQENAEKNNIINCQFYQADLNNDWHQQPWAKQHYNKVLLDPARAGAYQALTQLITFKVKALLYISCDPASLARDAKLLVENGYKIEKIALMDMFSQTKHAETMVMFSLSP